MTTTFKQFITETNIVHKWDISSVGEIEMVNLLNAHARSGLQAIKNGGVLFRGFSDSPGKGPLVMDSSRARRRSKDTDNIYQLMMDASPSLAEFPSRSNSFICSTSQQTAGKYGSGGVYAMIPFDGAKIAALSVADILSQAIRSPIASASAPDSFHRLSIFLTNIGIRNTQGSRGLDGVWDFTAAEGDAVLAKFTAEELLTIWDFSQPSPGFSRPSPQQDYPADLLDMAESSELKLSKASMAAISAFAKTLEGKTPDFSNQGLENIFNLFKENPSRRWTAMSGVIMTPGTLKLSLLTTGESIRNPYPRECWFSGKAIAMPVDLFKNITDKMRADGQPVHDLYRADGQPAHDLYDWR